MIKGFLLRRYSLLKFHTFRWLFAFIGPLLTFLYLLSEKPFGFSLFSEGEQIRLATYFSAPVVLIWLLHFYLIQPRIFKRLNILVTILWLTWINLFIGFYYYTFSEIYIFGSQFDFYFLPDILIGNFKVGGLISAFMVLIHGGYIIRRRVQRARALAKQRFIKS